MRANNIGKIIRRLFYIRNRFIYLIIGFILGISVTKFTNINTFINNNLYSKNISESNTIETTTISNNSAINIETCEYVRTKDGDTIVVNLNGKEETIRLLTIDCSESVHPDKSKNGVAGEIASSYTKGVLKKYTTLYLTSGKNNRDKYNRLLRIVWLEIPQDPLSEEELENKSLEGMLIKKNYCVVKDYGDSTYYKQLLNIYNKYNN